MHSPEESKRIFEEWRIELGLDNMQELWLYLGFEDPNRVPSWERIPQKEDNAS